MQESLVCGHSEMTVKVHYFVKWSAMFDCKRSVTSAFSVAGTRVWNAVPADVTSAPSLFTFRKRLKLHLFPFSYPGLVL